MVRAHASLRHAAQAASGPGPVGLAPSAAAARHAWCMAGLCRGAAAAPRWRAWARCVPAWRRDGPWGASLSAAALQRRVHADDAADSVLGRAQDGRRYCGYTTGRQQQTRSLLSCEVEVTDSLDCASYWQARPGPLLAWAAVTVFALTSSSGALAFAGSQAPGVWMPIPPGRLGAPPRAPVVRRFRPSA